MKTCTKCKCEKHLFEFGKHNSKKDGLRIWCKDCESASDKIYKKSDKGKQAQSNYKKSEKGKLSDSKYNNSEKGNQARDKYSKSEKGKIAQARLVEKRLLAIKQATPRWLNTIELMELKNIKDNCPLHYVIDHIVPIQGKEVCGLNVPCNLQFLTKKDNRSKSNKYESKWESEK